MYRFDTIPRLTINTVHTVIRVVRFFTVVAAFILLYKVLLEQFLDGSKQIPPLAAIWIMSAYIVLPKIHRTLTTYYLPNYFVGRIRSPSGLLSDPVNVAFFGKATNIHSAMKKAGWSKADPLTPKTIVKAAYCALSRKSYPHAPVGNMYLFNKKHDFAYQIEINGSPNNRHHIRFWRTPKGWRLPGGHEADWLASATLDTHVGLKIATGQIDHFIHVETDEERDFTIQTLKKAKVIKKLEIIKHFTDAYHDRSNGGDRIRTDGSLPFITL